MNHTKRSFFVTAALFAAFLAAACSGEKSEEQRGKQHESAESKGTAEATGDTIIVEMHSDANGNYYKPNEIEAHRGDVIRFVLKSGVHNVNFFPDSNSIKTGLPAPSEMLQLPDQTHDFVVNLQKGDYYFHCDPHAALGMKGELEVEDDD